MHTYGLPNIYLNFRRSEFTTLFHEIYHLDLSGCLHSHMTLKSAQCLQMGTLGSPFFLAVHGDKRDLGPAGHFSNSMLGKRCVFQLLRLPGWRVWAWSWLILEPRLVWQSSSDNEGFCFKITSIYKNQEHWLIHDWDRRIGCASWTKSRMNLQRALTLPRDYEIVLLGARCCSIVEECWKGLYNNCHDSATPHIAWRSWHCKGRVKSSPRNHDDLCVNWALRIWAVECSYVFPGLVAIALP